MVARISAPLGIIALLACGLLLRLLIAYWVLPDTYVSADVQGYTRWGLTVADAGFGEFYARADADYPPAFIYVMWLVSELGGFVAATADTGNVAAVTMSLMKASTMLFDICAGLLLYLIALNWAGSDPKARRIALTAAAIYLFNPVMYYDSAIWGQTDAVGACLMLLAVIALTRWPSEIAAAIGVLAALVKPQFGVVLIPLIGVVLLRRHLVSGRAFTTEASREREYWTRRDGPVRLLSCALVVIAVFYVVITPFNLDARSFLKLMTATAGGYQYLTVNAFNPWALVGSGSTPPIVAATAETFGEKPSWSRDDISLVGPLSGVEIGTVLLILGFLLGVARLLWRADRWSIVLVGFYLGMCFFMLPTRVHERYLVPAFAFASLLAAFDPKWLWATIALAAAALINLHSIFGMRDTVAWTIVHLPMSEIMRTPAGVLLSVVLHTTVFCFAIWSLRPRAVQSEAPWQAGVATMSR